MSTLHLQIVTPEALAFQAEVSDVLVPGVEGELGILPQHVPFMTQILPGELRFHQQGKEIRFAVGGGFLEVRPDRVSVLTDMAMEAGEINEQEVLTEIAEAQEVIKANRLSKEELATLEDSLQRSLAKLRVKQRP